MTVAADMAAPTLIVDCLFAPVDGASGREDAKGVGFSRKLREPGSTVSGKEGLSLCESTCFSMLLVGSAPR